LGYLSPPVAPLANSLVNTPLVLVLVSMYGVVCGVWCGSERAGIHLYIYILYILYTDCMEEMESLP